ncbi:MAG: hypothetical protein DME19_00760 [Verrucomicrobia bacterium]|nr:MAG: hypothetical protein DME19_00760 [Verrucomicrobiota bacterium]
MSLAEYLQESGFSIVFLRFASGLMLSLMPVETQSDSALRQTAGFPGTDLFTQSAVVRIRIELQQQNLLALREDPRRYVRSTIRSDGKAYRDVGVHLKGSTGSFRGVDDKPGLTLDFGRFNPDQKFHDLRKIHLNNSVEDPSYLNEQIGSELFRAAGVPAPRVSHALVEMNGRPLGLYVLKEGLTEDFLSFYFRRGDGNLYEPERGNDVDGRMKRLLGRDPENGQRHFSALAAAARETDLNRRRQRLEETLDMDRFITFMAVEVMTCHRDGYCVARNNFRLYEDPETKKTLLLPHGMDQLFGNADLPWKPHMAGLVARSVLETPEGRQRYEARFRALFTGVFNAQRLADRVNQIVGDLRPSLRSSEFKGIEQEAAIVRDRILKRELNLKRQLSRPESAPLDFKDGIACLSGWRKVDEPAGGRMEEAYGPDGIAGLHMVAGPATAASWRTIARLREGHYQFEGSAAIVAVKPLAFGKNQGAGLRVGGRIQPPFNFTGDASWKKLKVQFSVDAVEEDVELICELRARAGEARFDASSLRLIRINEPLQQTE